MKPLLTSLLLLTTLTTASIAQTSPPTQPPENLKGPFAVIQRSYTKVDAKKFPKPPADSLWQFRNSIGGAGTVEVGFQGKEVVYMIFRRGTGGSNWKEPEIRAIHSAYHETLLKEQWTGEKYNHALAPQINGAIITRKDFDAKSILSGS